MYPYPIFKESLASGIVLKFDSETCGTVVKETNRSYYKVGDYSTAWVTHTSESTWKDYEFKTIEEYTELCNIKSAEIKNNEKAFTDVKEDLPHNHYHKKISSDTIDVYTVLKVFNVEDQAIGHAIKKLLAGGERGVKSKTQDWQEAIDSIKRAIELEN